MEAQVLKRLFTVDEFHQMAEAGVFRDDDRLELVDGEIVQMTPIGSRHSGCVMRLNALLAHRVQPRLIVSVQGPIVLGDETELYPDIALLNRREDFYSHAHPKSGDVRLVVEVADSTLQYDRHVKVPRYARAGIPELWVVDLPGRAIDVYRQPAAGEYREMRRVQPGESLPVPGGEGPEIAVGEVLA